MDAALLALVLSTLRLATPLCLAAMGELVAERAGVLNIGIEGMMLAGAYAAFVAALVSGSATVGCSAGAAAGVALACVFAFFVVERRADPIVCGAALNILALGITGTLSRRFEILSFETPRVPDLLPGLYGVNGFHSVYELGDGLQAFQPSDIVLDLFPLSARPGTAYRVRCIHQNRDW